jgi:hypothetical protein
LLSAAGNISKRDLSWAPWGGEGLEPLVRVKQHPTLEYTVAAGFIPVDRLEDLEGIPHVVKTEASRPMRPELNRSVPEFVPTSFTTPPLLSKVLAWSLA